MSSWRQAEECSHVRAFAEPTWVVDQSDEAERNNRTYPGNGHQSTGNGVVFGFRLHRAFQIGSRLAQRTVSGNVPIGDGAQNRISFSRSSQLVSKALPLAALSNPGYADTKGFQHAPDMTFQILAKPDQTFAGLQ